MGWYGISMNSMIDVTLAAMAFGSWTFLCLFAGYKLHIAVTNWRIRQVIKTGAAAARAAHEAEQNKKRAEYAKRNGMAA